MNYTKLYPIGPYEFSYCCIQWHRNRQGQIYDQYYYPIEDNGETILFSEAYTTENIQHNVNS